MMPVFCFFSNIVQSSNVTRQKFNSRKASEKLTRRTRVIIMWKICHVRDLSCERPVMWEICQVRDLSCERSVMWEICLFGFIQNNNYSPLHKWIKWGSHESRVVILICKFYNNPSPCFEVPDPPIHEENKWSFDHTTIVRPKFEHRSAKAWTTRHKF